LHPNARPLDEAKRQLDLLLEQQEQLAPALYRDLALYLQVLREGLLHAVQQACFHLATQVVPERYGQLPPERRRAFQQRLQQLVQRCSVLLTVEQLMGLAAQQQRREHRQQQRRQQQLLQTFLEAGSSDSGSAESSPESAPSAAPQQLPAPGPSSVHLSLDLPLSADLFDRGLPGLAAALPASASQPAPPAPAAAEAGQELKLMQELFNLVSDGLAVAGSAEPEPAADSGDEAVDPQSAETSFPLGLDLDSRVDDRVTAPTLPRDPLLQLRWWTHFDRALRRRLRNLSHAVNVEMLRLGLAQGLLPLNLLDSVLDGQLEALPAPTNVLRLALPLQSLAALGPAAPSEVLTLLLRTGDLEYDQPRLRTCRKRLDQRRAALRTMAKRYRTWQRRVSALEAEQQWLQDSAPNPIPPEERL